MQPELRCLNCEREISQVIVTIQNGEIVYSCGECGEEYGGIEDFLVNVCEHCGQVIGRGFINV